MGRIIPRLDSVTTTGYAEGIPSHSTVDTHLWQVLLVVVQLVHIQVLGEVGQIQPGRRLGTTVAATAAHSHSTCARCGLGSAWHHPRTVGCGPGCQVVPDVVIGRRNRVVGHHLLQMVMGRRLVVMEQESATGRGPLRAGRGRVRRGGRQELEVILTAAVRATWCNICWIIGHHQCYIMDILWIMQLCLCLQNTD